MNNTMKLVAALNKLCDATECYDVEKGLALVKYTHLQSDTKRHEVRYKTEESLRDYIISLLQLQIDVIKGDSNV